MTAEGIDCSGLIHMSFRRLGVLVPRDSWQQQGAGTEIAEHELRPGDLVCYEGHSAFWIAPGRILHAIGRAGVTRVLEEPEPRELRTSFRSYRRLVTECTVTRPPSNEGEEPLVNGRYSVQWTPPSVKTS